MAEIDAGTEHHRTGAGDYADIVLTAVLDRFGRNTRTFCQGLMHPDAAHASVCSSDDKQPVGGSDGSVNRYRERGWMLARADGADLACAQYADGIQVVRGGSIIEDDRIDDAASRLHEAYL